MALGARSAHSTQAEHPFRRKPNVTVTPDYRFRVSHDLSGDFHNGREYERFAGRAFGVPRAPTDRPSPELLEWHAAEVFRG